jgi:SAM-dependent methyltransferase
VRVPDAVRWQDIECGGYSADLPLWRELAEEASGPVLDVGAGCGRVAVDLARHGHDVIALELDEELLGALAERARGLPGAVTPLPGDARDFALAAPVPLALVPMQTVQLLGGRDGRARFLACARAALAQDGILAAALADPYEGFDPSDPVLPLPDLREEDGWVYASQPVAVRTEGATTAIERRREVVGPDGTHREATDVVRLDIVGAAELEAEAAEHGFEALERRRVDETADHVGSEVVVLRRGQR